MVSKYQKDLNNFLANVSNFFDNHTNEKGENICFKHKVEHTGKTVYSIGIDLHLFKVTNEEKYKERIIKRLERVVKLFGEENGTHFFIPTGDPKWNMSNRIIDSGAAVDMLSLAILERKILGLDDDLINKIKYLVELCSDTYLIKNSVEKAHTNQRLWGATGLGTSYKVFTKEEYKKAILDSCERSFSEYRKDGSIPYVTSQEETKTHPSIVDTTTYYHSRHIAFMSYALECVGELDQATFDRIKPTVDFLAGMYQADGVKNIRLETKRWYFTSSYEVASHSYDVHAFVLAYRFTKNPKYAYYAKESLNQLYRHQVREDGGIDDNIAETKNFQCPYFWNSHCAWLTRVYDVIDEVYLAAEQHNTEHAYWFEESEIFNFRNENYAFIVRGSKKSTDSLWGPAIGGGSLLYFGTKDNGFKNILETSEYGYTQPGNFYIKKFKWNPKNWFNLPLSNIRAHLYHIKIEFRAGDYTSAWNKIKEFIKKEISLFEYNSSHNCIEIDVSLNKDSISFRGCLNKFSGDKYNGIEIIRTYAFMNDNLKIIENMKFQKDVEKIKYELPTFLSIDDASVKSQGKYLISDNAVTLWNSKVCEISFKL